MQVYVLESRDILIDYEGGCVCGVYSTRALADAAALLRLAEARAGDGLLTFAVYAVEVDAPADERILVDYVDVIGLTRMKRITSRRPPNNIRQRPPTKHDY